MLIVRAGNGVQARVRQRSRSVTRRQRGTRIRTVAPPRHFRLVVIGESALTRSRVCPAVEILLRGMAIARFGEVP